MQMVSMGFSFTKYLKSDESGQSTVEFAVVMAAVLAIIVGLGVVMNFADGGILVQHAVSASSHNVSGALLGIAGDLFCV